MLGALAGAASATMANNIANMRLAMRKERDIFRIWFMSFLLAIYGLSVDKKSLRVGGMNFH
jgi:hypothetical protein